VENRSFARLTHGHQRVRKIIGLGMSVIILLILLRFRPNAFWVLIGAGVFRYLMALVLW